MAATALTITEVPRAYDDGVLLAAAATLNNVDGHEFRPTGKEYVYFSCSADGSVTIATEDDPYGRTGDVIIAMTGAGADSVFGPVPTTGFASSTGYVNIKATGTITAVVFR